MSEAAIVLKGKTQAICWDFLRTKSAISIEQKGFKFGKRSVVHAAIQKGYVPESLVKGKSVPNQREIALRYMSYVSTLLTSGHPATKAYGEEIVTELVVYVATEDCGCPVYQGTKKSRALKFPDMGTMCIHDKAE